MRTHSGLETTIDPGYMTVIPNRHQHGAVGLVGEMDNNQIIRTIYLQTVIMSTNEQYLGNQESEDLKDELEPSRRGAGRLRQGRK